MPSSDADPASVGPNSPWSESARGSAAGDPQSRGTPCPDDRKGDRSRDHSGPDAALEETITTDAAVP